MQDDIKRVLAYSTVSQLGYMMTAIGAGVAAAGFLHLLTHGLFKALLFLGAGAVIHAVGSNDLPDMGGLARRMPQTAIVFIIGTLSLAGIPFFGGFLSKEEILGAVWAGGLTGPFVLLMLVAFLTAFYMFRVVFLAFFGTPAPVARNRARATVGRGVRTRRPAARPRVSRTRTCTTNGRRRRARQRDAARARAAGHDAAAAVGAGARCDGRRRDVDAAARRVRAAPEYERRPAG